RLEIRRQGLEDRRVPLAGASLEPARQLHHPARPHVPAAPPQHVGDLPDRRPVDAVDHPAECRQSRGGLGHRRRQQPAPGAVPFSRRRIAAVAVYPSISGISQSMRTRSGGRRSSSASASLPLSATLTRYPNPSSIATATSRFTALSSTTRTWAPSAVSTGGGA